MATVSFQEILTTQVAPHQTDGWLFNLPASWSNKVIPIFWANAYALTGSGYDSAGVTISAESWMHNNTLQVHVLVYNPYAYIPAGYTLFAAAIRP